MLTFFTAWSQSSVGIVSKGVSLLNEDLDIIGLLTRLQSLIDSLQQLVHQSDENHQQMMTEALEAVYSALDESIVESLSPTWTQQLKKIGFHEYLGSQLKEKLVECVNQNQITPVRVHLKVKEWHSIIERFKSAIEEVTRALPQLNIGRDELEPGQCELGFLVPREVLHNHFSEYVKELRQFELIFRMFSEITTGKAEEFIVRTISSDLVVYVNTTPAVAALVAMVLERIITVYKELLKIRRLRNELSAQEVSDGELKSIDTHINIKMDKAIEKLALEVMAEYYKPSSVARKNELTDALRISLNKLANRIDRGYNIEVRVAELPKQEVEEGQDNVEPTKTIQHFEAIKKAAPNLQFIRLEGEPVLSLPEAATPRNTQVKRKKKTKRR
ncbi:MAG: hypothetical protein P8Z79_11245 [Sedimentisphaerales bacterium]